LDCFGTEILLIDSDFLESTNAGSSGPTVLIERRIIMLSKFKKSQEGFTLIELLIVVAIIGILAAIAIPQFSAYRMRAYNSTTLSDLRNAKTAEESLYADMVCYGTSDGGNQAGAPMLADAAVAAGGALVYNGPVTAAVGGKVPSQGARFAGVNASGATGAIPLGISNGVNLIADVSTDPSSTPAAGAYNSYVLYARHDNGDTSYAADSDNSVSIFRVQNPLWAGNADFTDAVGAIFIAPTIGSDDINGIGGGGDPTAEWTIM
jgi:prepilin-type N-terminal cleavage/methylation domain-containing protein